MWQLQTLVVVYLFRMVTSIVEMINEGKFCDLLSEATKKQCYVKETLVNLMHSPNQLAVDNLTDTLYFSFDSGQGEYSAAILNLDTKKVTILDGIKDAFAIANDPSNGEIYFGGSHGLYKYNSGKRTLKRLKVDSLDIWWLVINRRVYFIRFPSLKAYYYTNKTVNVVPELRHDVVNQFVFDADKNIIFINSSGLYRIKNGEDKAVLLKNHPKFLSLATNNAGLVHLSSDNGIYILSKMINKVKKIVKVEGALGMTFDRDNNIIYSDSHEMVRLKLISKTKL